MNDLKDEIDALCRQVDKKKKRLNDDDNVMATELSDVKRAIKRLSAKQSRIRKTIVLRDQLQYERDKHKYKNQPRIDQEPAVKDMSKLRMHYAKQIEALQHREKKMMGMMDRCSTYSQRSYGSQRDNHYNENQQWHSHGGNVERIIRIDNVDHLTIYNRNDSDEASSMDWMNDDYYYDESPPSEYYPDPVEIEYNANMSSKCAETNISDLSKQSEITCANALEYSGQTSASPYTNATGQTPTIQKKQTYAINYSVAPDPNIDTMSAWNGKYGDFLDGTSKEQRISSVEALHNVRTNDHTMQKRIEEFQVNNENIYDFKNEKAAIPESKIIQSNYQDELVKISNEINKMNNLVCPTHNDVHSIVDWQARFGNDQSNIIQNSYQDETVKMLIEAEKMQNLVCPTHNDVHSIVAWQARFGNDLNKIQNQENITSVKVNDKPRQPFDDYYVAMESDKLMPAVNDKMIPSVEDKFNAPFRVSTCSIQDLVTIIGRNRTYKQMKIEADKYSVVIGNEKFRYSDIYKVMVCEDSAMQWKLNTKYGTVIMIASSPKARNRVIAFIKSRCCIV